MLSIKIEEKEKRDSYRIKELEKKVEDFLADVKYINEPLEELVYKQAAGVDETEEIPAPAETAEVAAEVGAVPQIFRMARNMTMPQCPAVEPAADVAEASAEVGAVPQIFRMARNLTMPQCPAVESTAEVAEDAAEVGAVPQIFTVARNMTMPAASK